MMREEDERRLREATDALRRIANEPPPQAWADASEIARAALAAVEGTAATPGEVPDGYFVPEGDKRCNAQTDTGGPTPAICLLRKGHDGPHRNMQGYWSVAASAEPRETTT